jgi:DNA-binding IscR family transcriptional regulator
MKMPEKVRISIDLIKELKAAQDQNPKRVSDLAVRINTTEAFLLQVVRLLGREGIINVVRGPGGGVTPGITDTNVLKVCQTLGYFNEELPPEDLNKESGAVEQKLRGFLSTIQV